MSTGLKRLLVVLLWFQMQGIGVSVLGLTKSVPASEPPPESVPRPVSECPLSSLHLTDLQGKPISLWRNQDSPGVGLVFLSTECPIARRYLPEISRLSKEFADQAIAIFGIVSDPSTTRAATIAWQQEFGFEFPILFDHSGILAEKLQPTHTPEAFVLNRSGTVLYRGRIDDCYGSVGRSRQQPTERNFWDALTALAKRQIPKVPRTTPIGCPREPIQPTSRNQSITYCRDVAPILYQQCLSCHRTGQVAPFALTDYEDAAKRANWIAQIVELGQMPPWPLEPGVVHFRDERLLSDTEKTILRVWAENGAPLGNRADLPERPTFSEGWLLGEPDLLIKMPEPVTIPADGPDLYRSLALPLHLSADQALAAVDFRPGNPLVVHHAVLMMLPANLANQLAAADQVDFDPIRDGLPQLIQFALQMQKRGSTTGFGPIGNWAPGNQATRLPTGYGMLLNQEAVLLLQMHYAPSGKQETDCSEVGLYFCKTPVQHTVTSFALNVMNLNIPPGEAAYRVTATFTLPVPVELLGIAPHMHLLGRKMRVEAVCPDGTVEPLLQVRDWDWNWQEQYRYETPKQLPAGTQLHLEAIYDNSSANPANPHQPPRTVRYGRQTTDEMCLCFFQVALQSPEDQLLLRSAAVRNTVKSISSSCENWFAQPTHTD